MTVFPHIPIPLWPVSTIATFFLAAVAFAITSAIGTVAKAAAAKDVLLKFSSFHFISIG
jgi:hypothetical protein